VSDVPDIRYTSGSGVSIAYQEFGSGPPLVMVLTVPSHLDLMWIDPEMTQVMRRLGTVAHVVVFDPRGVGLSDPVSHVPTLEELADDIAAVMDAAGIDRASLFATGTGCAGAVMLAARSAERVDSLLLWSPWAQGILSEGGPASIVGWDDRMAESLDRWNDLVGRWGEGWSLDAMAPGLATVRARRSWGVLERASASPAAIRAVTQAALEVDLRTVLPLVQAPTVVLMAEDGFQPPAICEHVAELVQHGEFHLLPPSSDAADMSAYWEPVLELLVSLVTGHAVTILSDRVHATVMFTDIVGSTELAVAKGDGPWRAVLEAHERILRDLVDAHGGRVVKMLGDGSMSVFDGPVRATRCGVALQPAVAGLDIELRVGLHAGEVEQVGHDLAGLAVHVAARVEALARPGEVWMSQPVKDLLVASGLEVHDEGHHELKGVGSQQLFSYNASSPGPVAVTSATAEPRPLDRLLLALARRVPGMLRVLDKTR
jgi:class 3 adenylate cyclase